MFRVFISIGVLCGLFHPLLAYKALSGEVSKYAWMDEAILDNFSWSRQKEISIEMLEKVWGLCKQDPDNFSRYQIIHSKVYGPGGPIFNFLQVLAELYSVPDIDFIYCHGDGYFETQEVPCFTASTRRNTPNVILFTDRMFEILRQDVGWNRWIRKINKAQSLWPWGKRIEKAFWRGFPTCPGYRVKYNLENWSKVGRGRAVYLSHYVSPEDIDAAFVPFTETSEIVENYPDFTRSVPMASFLPPDRLLSYKYHINLEGVTCVYPGYQWRLLSGSLVFKQESEEVQWFYYFLKPWVHYVPVREDLSDLIENIQWAKAHDLEAKAIGENARHFALNNLMPEHFLLYCYKALVFYASLQSFSPKPYLEYQKPHFTYADAK